MERRFLENFLKSIMSFLGICVYGSWTLSERNIFNKLWKIECFLLQYWKVNREEEYGNLEKKNQNVWLLDKLYLFFNALYIFLHIGIFYCAGRRNEKTKGTKNLKIAQLRILRIGTGCATANTANAAIRVWNYEKSQRIVNSAN